MDDTTAFLHGELEEEIYMSQPQGFEISKEGQEQVCQLRKSLYGLKQSPRQQNKRFDAFVTSIGFNISYHNTCFYYKGDSIENMTLLLIYVDDMLLASKNMENIKKLKRDLNE